MSDSAQDNAAIQVNITDGVLQICYSPTNSADAGTLLLDVDPELLKHEIASQLGVQYLGPAPKGSHQKVLDVVHGCAYGVNNREMLALPVARTMGDPLWVIFLYDSGAPVSQFSKQAWKALELSGTEAGVTIGGHTVKVHASPPETHFRHVNLLGQDLKMQLDLWCIMKDPGSNALYFCFGTSSIPDVEARMREIIDEKMRKHLNWLLKELGPQIISVKKQQAARHRFFRGGVGALEPGDVQYVDDLIGPY